MFLAAETGTFLPACRPHESADRAPQEHAATSNTAPPAPTDPQDPEDVARAPTPPAPVTGLEAVHDRTGETACALCPGPRPRIVVVGTADDPRFVELARDADAVAYKYRERLDAQVVVLDSAPPGRRPAVPEAPAPDDPIPHVQRGARTKETRPGGAPEESGDPGALARALRVEAPVLHLRCDRAPAARLGAEVGRRGPLVRLISPAGTVVYEAFAPADLADLHDAFLALAVNRTDASARRGTSGG